MTLTEAFDDFHAADDALRKAWDGLRFIQTTPWADTSLSRGLSCDEIIRCRKAYDTASNRLLWQLRGVA